MSQPKRKNALRMPIMHDHFIYWSLIILAGFGLVMVTSASMGLAVGDNNYLIMTVAKQLIFSVFGYIAMVLAARYFSFKKVSENIGILEIGTGIILFACLLFSASGGAHAWIRIPLAGIDMSIQPSEFAKISVMLIIAAHFGGEKPRQKRDWDLVKGPTVTIAVFLFEVGVLQSDFGSMVVMGIIATVCFLIPQNPQLKKYQKTIRFLYLIGFVGVILVLSPLGNSLVKMLPLKNYQINRILSAIDPFQDQYDTGYQLINGLISFATGGFFGLGFGNSVRKYTSFPAANTDFILAIVVEELGFLGFAIIFCCYIVIIYRLFYYAMRMKNEKGKIVLIGTAMYMLVHFLFNVGGVTGLIPLTGVPLLMISAGGSSTMSIMMAIGISQAVISQYNRGILE